MYSVVIPIYNEAENIELVCREVETAMRKMSSAFEIILVDDGSSDSSFQVMLKTKETIPEIRILKFKRNCGQTAAFWAGIKNAKGNVIITLDGDGQNDPGDIPYMVARLDHADIVCGIRKNRKDTGWRKFQSRVANRFRDFFLHDGVIDTGCSLKAFKKPPEGLLPEFTGLHRFIPALLKQGGYKIDQIRVNHRERQHGTTKYSFKNRAFRSFLDLLAVCWMKSRRFTYELEKDIQ